MAPYRWGSSPCWTWAALCCPSPGPSTATLASWQACIPRACLSKPKQTPWQTQLSTLGRESEPCPVCRQYPRSFRGCWAGRELSGIDPITNVYRGDAYQEKAEAFFSGPWAKFGGKISAMLGDKPFFLGDRPFFCDFVMYHPLDLVRLNRPDALAPFPNLSGFLGRMETLPGTAEYLKRRPVPVGIGSQPRLVSPEEAAAVTRR